ncbi:MAG: ubiquinone/menaquinone biosynthesis C-methylase UbiE [Candidatus Azotimanducaceae bacterium]|jgi:ubiquinone/menaquinone biosynthesis C-methylase UbiE
MCDETFYQDHWREIEAERLARYEEMFVFRPQHEALLKPLQLEAGLSIADYGCGPGFLAMELARRVGATGRVFGF